MLKQTFILVVLLSFLSAASVRAEETIVADGPESTITEVGNKICPVSGGKVGEMGEVVKVAYKGKMYNLCCAMCQKDFDKDPDKYSKMAEDEVSGATK